MSANTNDYAINPHLYSFTVFIATYWSRSVNDTIKLTPFTKYLTYGYEMLWQRDITVTLSTSMKLPPLCLEVTMLRAISNHMEFFNIWGLESVRHKNRPEFIINVNEPRQKDTLSWPYLNLVSEWASIEFPRALQGVRHRLFVFCRIGGGTVIAPWFDHHGPWSSSNQYRKPMRGTLCNHLITWFIWNRNYRVWDEPSREKSHPQLQWKIITVITYADIYKMIVNDCNS